MKKALGYVVVGLSCLACGYGLARVLHPSGQLPPPVGRNPEVIDAIPGYEVVQSWSSGPTPAHPMRHIRARSGTSPLTLSSLSYYVRSKHGGAEGSREAAIRDFIRLHNPWETLVLSSSRDIPGFDPGQLDPDLRALALEQVSTPHDSSTDTVVYAWTKVGGELKRYRFRTIPGFAPYCSSCLVLQTEIGDALYRE